MRGKSVFYPMGWDDNGLPTERRVQNYFGVRCDPSLPYDADFTPPEKPDAEAAGPDQPAQLRRAVRAARRGGRAGLRVAVAHPGPLGRLVAALHDDRPQGAEGQPDARSCATSPAARPTSRRRRPCGTSPSRPPSRRPSSRRATTPAPTTASRSTGRGDGEPVYIETTRPELIPSVVALIAHPDDERYQPLFGTTVTSSGLRRRDPGPRPPGRRDGQGRRHRDVLHVRRPHRRHVVARAQPARAHRDRSRRPDPARDAGVARERAGRRGLRGAQGQDDLQRPRGHRGRAARDRRPRRRAQAHPADGQLLREGRQAARDRRHPPVVHPQRWPRRRRARRDAGARRRDHLAAEPHEAPLRQLGRRAQRRLADLAPALLRHPVPGLVPPRRRRRARLRPPAAPPRGRSCRSTRRRRHPRATTSRSAASPAASSATPT